MQILALDIRTLSFITMSIALLFAIWLFFFGLSQKTFKGFYLLALANASLGVGLLLLGLRDILPSFITIILANTLLILGLVFYFEGGRRFLGVANRLHPISIAAIILGIGLFAYYTYHTPSVNHRIVTICLIAGLLSALSARDLFCNKKDHWRVAATITASIFVLYSLFQIYRVFFTLMENQIHSFMTAGPVHAFAYIFLLLLASGPAFGFVWMVSKQLEFNLTELTLQDPLTKILNRRGVENLAQHEFYKRDKVENQLAVMMLDIDHFKNINDSYGHNGGDAVLVEFVAIIRDALRPYDIFGRIGGEEFVVILPHTTLDQALKLAERLRERVESFVFDAQEHKIKITTSIGVVGITSEADTLEEMMINADKALYQSKRNGRNQVTFFEQRGS